MVAARIAGAGVAIAVAATTTVTRSTAIARSRAPSRCSERGSCSVWAPRLSAGSRAAHANPLVVADAAEDTPVSSVRVLPST